MHAARPEERLVRVELGEERLGLRAVAGRVARPDLTAAQQQVDLVPGREHHRDRHRVGQHPAAEPGGQRPGHLERGRPDVDHDRVLRLDQRRREPRDGHLAVAVQGAARGEGALGRPDRQRPAVDPLQQAGVTQAAQVAPDRLGGHAEPLGQVLGRDRLGLAQLGQDHPSALSWQHRGLL
jgi:hypothetical protein